MTLHCSTLPCNTLHYVTLHTYMYKYIHIYKDIMIDLYIYIYKYLYLYIDLFIYIYIFTHIYISKYIHIYLSIYSLFYMHTHTTAYINFWTLISSRLNTLHTFLWHHWCYLWASHWCEMPRWDGWDEPGRWRQLFKLRTTGPRCTLISPLSGPVENPWKTSIGWEVILRIYEVICLFKICPFAIYVGWEIFSLWDHCKDNEGIRGNM